MFGEGKGGREGVRREKKGKGYVEREEKDGKVRELEGKGKRRGRGRRPPELLSPHHRYKILKPPLKTLYEVIQRTNNKRFLVDISTTLRQVMTMRSQVIKHAMRGSKWCKQ